MSKALPLRWDDRRETWFGRIRGADGKLSPWTDLGIDDEGVARLRVERWQATGELLNSPQPEPTEPLDPPEWTEEDFARAIRGDQRRRIMEGKLGPGDVAALRRFVDLTQEQFAEALGISVHTLRNWEQDRRLPQGPGLALLRIAARNPHVLRQLVPSAA